MHHSFDWIFFGIVGIPFVLALVALFRPELVEQIIREPSHGDPLTGRARQRETGR